MNEITQPNLVLKKDLGIKLLFLVFLNVLCFNIEGQSIQGSFESKFKRYVKGESYSGAATLINNEIAWKGERIYSQMVLWSSSNQSNLTYEVSDFTDGANTILSSNATLLFSKDVKGDPEARACSSYPSQRAEVVEIADALSFSPQPTLDAANPTKIWLRLNVPSNTVAGNYSGTIKVKQGGADQVTFSLNIEVLDKTLPDQANWNFHLDLWQYPYQILKHYNDDHPGNEITIWSQAHFDMFEPYYELLADAGQKVISAHIKDGGQGQPSMVKWTLKTNGTWEYDFTAFDKYVDLLTSLGISKQINCFSPVGWNGDVIPYYDEATGTNKELSAPVASAIYDTRWDHFLSAFKVHLDSKGWFNKSVLFLDEIHESELLDVIDMITSNNTNWKIGLSFFDPPSQQINDAMYDMSGNLGTASSLGRTNKISTFYTSCAQTIPNNYVTPDSNPGEMNWMAWHVANQNLSGYLRWALDYWTLNDPLDARDGTNTAGDNSLVYRSSNNLSAEAYSSYQLEHLRNGIQDFEKIQILKSELEGSTDPIDQEALQALNDKIDQFGTASGPGSEALVSQGEALLNDIVKGTFTYCTVNGEATGTAYTQWVSTTGASENISYWSGSYPGGYSRHTSGKIQTVVGSIFSLTIENSTGSNCARTKVWIDWNNDDDFDDAGEEILNAGLAASCGNATSNTFNVTVPIDAFVGLNRMRVQVRDSNDSEPISCGNVSNSSTTDFDISILDTYCSVQTDYNQIYYVKKLSTDSCNGNIDFETTYVPLKGYGHHTQTVATANRNSSFNIDLENSASSGCARTTIWVDWNQDNDFSDPGEEIFTSGIANSCANQLGYNSIVTVPSNAVLGTTRMRVQIRDAYQALPEACVADAVSGTTDFNIEVIDNLSLGCPPMILSPSTDENLTSTSSTISWTNNSTAVDNWRLEVTSENFGDGTTVHYDQILTSSTLSALVDNLPNDGRLLDIKLSWQISGVWNNVVSTNRAYDIHCLVGGGTFESYYVQQLNTTGGSSNISYSVSDFPNGGYDYHVDSRAVVDEGSSFTINITTSSASSCARFKLWIDWNEDGDFDDAGEEIHSAGVFQGCASPIDYNIPVNVPTNSIGVKRLRMQLRDAWQPEPTPCGINNHTGSVDFDIEVVSSNNILPSVSITSPTNGTDYNTLQQITIDADATDSDGSITQVEFFVDGTSAGIDTSSPYSINWMMPSWGNYQLTAKATDNQGAETTSATVSISATDPNGSGCTEINNESFENGWGIWNGGGSDALRIASDANTGAYSIRLRDNTSSSVMTTNNLDLNTSTSVKINFSYIAYSMENNEDFWLQVSTNGGTSFTTVKSWVSGTDFTNGQRENVSFDITGLSFTATTRLRLRCDASNNGDEVYIDDIVIEGCGSGSSSKGTNKVKGGNEVIESNVEDNLLKEEIKVYPNPLKNSSLYISSKAFVNETVSVQVFSTTGQMVLNSKKVFKQNEKIEIPILPKGVYFLKLKLDKNSFVKKVIIDN